jgi:hypothetical protein
VERKEVSPSDSSDSALNCHKIIFTASHTSLQPNSDSWKMEGEHRKKMRLNKKKNKKTQFQVKIKFGSALEDRRLSCEVKE